MSCIGSSVDEWTNKHIIYLYILHMNIECVQRKNVNTMHKICLLFVLNPSASVYKVYSEFVCVVVPWYSLPNYTSYLFSLIFFSSYSLHLSLSLSLSRCGLGTQSAKLISFTPLLCPKNLLNFSKRKSLRKSFFFIFTSILVMRKSGWCVGFKMSEWMNEYIVCINKTLMQMLSKQYSFCRIDCRQISFPQPLTHNTRAHLLRVRNTATK